MAKANDPPLAFGEIIDRIEEMRESCSSFKGHWRRWNLPNPPLLRMEPQMGIKADGKRSFRGKSKIELGSIRFWRPL